MAGVKIDDVDSTTADHFHSIFDHGIVPTDGRSRFNHFGPNGGRMHDPCHRQGLFLGRQNLESLDVEFIRTRPADASLKVTLDARGRVEDRTESITPSRQ